MRLEREKLGAALRQARLESGYSIRDVETKCGLSRSAISRAERGNAEAYATADTVIVLCRFLDLDPCGFVKQFHVDTPSGQETAGGAA